MPPRAPPPLPPLVVPVEKAVDSAFIFCPVAFLCFVDVKEIPLTFGKTFSVEVENGEEKEKDAEDEEEEEMG